MQETSSPPENSPSLRPEPQTAAARRDREAAALRANLARRKQQQRARQTPSTKTQDPEPWA